MFILFLTERDRAWVGEGQRERERDTESETGSGLWAISTEPHAGLKLTDLEIMTWAKVGRSTDWATQAPPRAFQNKNVEGVELFQNGAVTSPTIQLRTHVGHLGGSIS